MEDVIRWTNDIGMVFENHVGASWILQQMLADAHDERELTRMLWDFYEESIDAVLRETPEDAVGHWLVREFCTNLPSSVFEQLAHEYWEAKWPVGK